MNLLPNAIESFLPPRLSTLTKPCQQDGFGANALLRYQPTSASAASWRIFVTGVISLDRARNSMDPNQQTEEGEATSDLPLNSFKLLLC